MPIPAIIAHRGDSARFRENSPAAWEGAMEAGADAIEVDVRATRDGALVCCHDADLRRLGGRDVTVAETDSADLARIRADGFPAAPPLALLFETVPADRSILFDVKDERPASLGILLAALACERDRDLMLGLHVPASVRLAREGGWTRPVLGLVSGSDEEAFFHAGGDILRLWEWDTAPGRVAAQLDRGRRVWVTAGEGATGRRVGDIDAGELLCMARQGVTGFLVNDPGEARRALGAAGEPRPCR